MNTNTSTHNTPSWIDLEEDFEDAIFCLASHLELTLTGLADLSAEMDVVARTMIRYAGLSVGAVCESCNTRIVSWTPVSDTEARAMHEMLRAYLYGVALFHQSVRHSPRFLFDFDVIDETSGLLRDEGLELPPGIGHFGSVTAELVSVNRIPPYGSDPIECDPVTYSAGCQCTTPR